MIMSAVLTKKAGRGNVQHGSTRADDDETQQTKQRAQEEALG